MLCLAVCVGGATYKIRSTTVASADLTHDTAWPAGDKPVSNALPSPWLQADVGAVTLTGSANYASGLLTIMGTGDIHRETSAYHLVYQAKSGDWRVEANILTLTGSGEYISCGPFIADAQLADSKWSYITPNLAFAGGKANAANRTTSGAGVYEAQTYSTFAWSAGRARIDKIGSTFTEYVSQDNGSTWDTIGSGTWTPAGTFSIGVAVDSGGTTDLATCVQQGLPVLTSLASSSAGVLDFVAVGSGTAANSTVAENAGTFSGPCVSRSVTSSGAITVPIQNLGTGTAVAGTHFTNPPYPQTLSWANGESGTKCGSVAVLNVAAVGSHTINYNLGTPTGGATLGTQTTHTLTIADAGTPAMKFQPGFYALFNKTCYPWDGTRGCTTAEILDTISTEICPNSNFVGLKLLGLPSFFMSNTPNVYTGTNQGFALFDQVLDALAACNKYLMIQGIHTVQVNLPDISGQFFPTYTYPSSWGAGGTAAAGAYGLVVSGQASQPSGMIAKVWQSDWKDLAIAATAAYCSRYEVGGAHPSSAFYAINLIYWNTSLALDSQNLPAGYSEATFNNLYRQYLAGQHSACPHTTGLATLDFANPFPGQMSTHLADMRDNTKASMANNDTVISGPSWGQQVYSGMAGSPSVTDFRGVVRYIEEVETPDMCGYVNNGGATPAQLFSIMQNGNANQRARWPSHIVITIAPECDPNYGWAAWKTYIQSIGGKVMNGRDNTLRTPAEVKASWCETAMVCD